MKGRQIRYSQDELDWLKSHCTLVAGEYHGGFCAAFNRFDVSAVNLHALRKRRGWKTGRTGCFEKGLTPHNKGKPFPVAANNPNCKRNQFRRGGLPHNTKFAGHERLSKDGYWEVSVEQINPHTGFNRRYVLKHRWLWEQKNGPIPVGHALKCLDGNRQNTAPENWEAIPRGILPRLIGGRFKTKIAYDEAPPELKPAVLATAKLAYRVKSAGKNSGKKSSPILQARAG